MLYLSSLTTIAPPSTFHILRNLTAGFLIKTFVAKNQVVTTNKT